MKPYMNPYLAGFLLGALLLLTIFITGRGLGASGAVKSTVIAVTETVHPEMGESSAFFVSETPPLRSWLVFSVLGLLAGAFVSGFLSGRLKLNIEKGPRITNSARLILAVTGGVLFGIGSQFGRGCTSGAALSGMAVYSAAGFLTLIAMFGTGYIISYFFRKLWL
ncbi:MAG: YeeE/YedE thiosulfate transporter family protein [Cyclonatronaceae bacterium]